MAKPFAAKFYKTRLWQDTRAAYLKYRHGLCEICLAKGIYKPCEIVHHKIELTPDNIDDPTVTLNWDNLQCVCRECHAEIHEYYARFKNGNARNRRYIINDDGSVKIKTEKPPRGSKSQHRG